METAILVVALVNLGVSVACLWYDRVVISDTNKKWAQRFEIMRKKHRSEIAVHEESVTDLDKQVMELRAELESKNTRPVSAEPRRIRARSMSQAEQMAEDEIRKADTK